MLNPLQIDILRDHCEELLLEQLKGDNCIEMYRLACLYNCPNLELKAWPSMLDGFTNLWKTYDYDNLTLNEIISIIREDRLVTLDEEHVCEAVCKWIDFDLDQRSKYAFKLLCHVRLPHISREYLVYHLSRVQYFIDDPQCRRLIEEVKHFHMLPARMLDYSSPRMKYRADDELEEVLLVITENSDDRGSFYQGGWCLWAFSYHQRRWFTLAPIPLADSPGQLKKVRVQHTMNARIITTTMGDEVFITSIDEDDSSLVLKLTSEFGFTDAGIELPVDSKILAITHSEGQL
ncbi:KELC-like protein, partial [Mya arenaria]